MIRDLTLLDAVIVCSDMRPEDAACVRAVSGREPGDWFAVDRWGTRGPAWALEQDGQPWAIGGLSLLNEWAGVMWFVARPGMRRSSWGEVLRASQRVLGLSTAPSNPERRQRIEAHVLHGWSGASRLVDHLGFVLEGIRRGAGSNGEAFEMWAMVANGRKTPAAQGQTKASEVTA